MFACALTGWALAGTFRNPLTRDLLGLALPRSTKARIVRCTDYSRTSHKILAYLLAALVVIHMLGAMRHHLIKHNDVLRRMLLAKP